MDDELMSLLSLETAPAWLTLLGLSAHLAAGMALGVLYFRSLWWSARLLVSGRRMAMVVSLTIGRFAVLGGLLLLASREGALPLLAVVLGLLIARSAVMRRVKRAAP
jgi:F1F0 ATPase subunit 2